MPREALAPAPPCFQERQARRLLMKHLTTAQQAVSVPAELGGSAAHLNPEGALVAVAEPVVHHMVRGGVLALSLAQHIRKQSGTGLDKEPAAAAAAAPA
jgi:hypothetical protein